MYYSYVLYSDRFLKFYIGMTDDISRRLAEHNAGKMKSTKPYMPWRVVWIEEYADRLSAREREKYLK